MMLLSFVSFQTNTKKSRERDIEKSLNNKRGKERRRKPVHKSRRSLRQSPNYLAAIKEKN
jgi:hypothetical protein